MELDSKKLKSKSRLADSTAKKLVLLGTAGLVMLLCATTLPSAQAKILPTGKPDIALDILIVPEEIIDEDGGITYERVFATEENFQGLYHDIGRLHQIFDEVMVPAATQFIKEHWSELADKDVDGMWIRYDEPDSLLVSVGPVHGTVQVEEPSPGLEVADSIAVRLPASWWYYTNQDPDHWLGTGMQLPNASTRVAFLTHHMQDLLDRHKPEMITSVTVDEDGAQIGKVLGGFSAVMLYDMARIDTSYRDEGYAYVQRDITEYITDTHLILPLPPSAGSLYMPPKYQTNEPLFFTKSANAPLTLLTSLSKYGMVTGATLTYPDGRQAELEPVRVDSVKTETQTEAYNTFEYVHYIPSSEPSGLYQLVINAPPASSSVDLSVRVTSTYLPPDYGSWYMDSVVIDEASYPVRYRISAGAQVSNMFADLPAKAVMVRIDNSGEDSRLIIELPRSVVDSVFEDGADSAFLVTLSDFDVENSGAKVVEYDEILANDQVRVVGIDLEEGTDLVQIRGTQIVPEFSHTALMLAGMATTFVALAARAFRARMR